MKRTKPHKHLKQQEASVHSGGSYDAVESAIDLAKKSTGSWKGLAGGRRIKPWVAEIRPAATDRSSSGRRV